MDIDIFECDSLMLPVIKRDENGLDRDQKKSKCQKELLQGYHCKHCDLQWANPMREREEMERHHGNL